MRENNAYKTINWEHGRVNYEDGRQNNRHVRENCTGTAMDNAHKAEIMEHWQKIMPMWEIMHIYLNIKHSLPTWPLICHPVNARSNLVNQKCFHCTVEALHTQT